MKETVSASKRKNRMLQDWERQALADAYLAGEKLEALAAEFNTKVSTISRLAERAGFARRTNVGPRAKGRAPKPRGLRALKRQLRQERQARLAWLAEKRATESASAGK